MVFLEKKEEVEEEEEEGEERRKRRRKEVRKRRGRRRGRSPKFALYSFTMLFLLGSNGVMCHT